VADLKFNAVLVVRSECPTPPPAMPGNSTSTDTMYSVMSGESAYTDTITDAINSAVVREFTYTDAINDAMNSPMVKETTFGNTALIEERSDSTAVIEDTSDYTAVIEEKSDYTAVIEDTSDYTAVIEDTSDYTAVIEDTGCNYTAGIEETSDNNPVSRVSSYNTAMIAAVSKSDVINKSPHTSVAQTEASTDYVAVVKPPRNPWRMLKAAINNRQVTEEVFEGLKYDTSANEAPIDTSPVKDARFDTASVIETRHDNSTTIEQINNYSLVIEEVIDNAAVGEEASKHNGVIKEVSNDNTLTSVSGICNAVIKTSCDNTAEIEVASQSNVINEELYTNTTLIEAARGSFGVVKPSRKYWTVLKASINNMQVTEAIYEELNYDNSVDDGLSSASISGYAVLIKATSDNTEILESSSNYPATVKDVKDKTSGIEEARSDTALIDDTAGIQATSYKTAVTAAPIDFTAVNNTSVDYSAVYELSSEYSAETAASFSGSSVDEESVEYYEAYEATTDYPAEFEPSSDYTGVRAASNDYLEILNAPKDHSIVMDPGLYQLKVSGILEFYSSTTYDAIDFAELIEDVRITISTINCILREDEVANDDGAGFYQTSTTETSRDINLSSYVREDSVKLLISDVQDIASHDDNICSGNCVHDREDNLVEYDSFITSKPTRERTSLWDRVRSKMNSIITDSLVTDADIRSDDFVTDDDCNPVDEFSDGDISASPHPVDLNQVSDAETCFVATPETWATPEVFRSSLDTLYTTSHETSKDLRRKFSELEFHGVKNPEASDETFSVEEYSNSPVYRSRFKRGCFYEQMFVPNDNDLLSPKVMSMENSSCNLNLNKNCRIMGDHKSVPMSPDLESSDSKSLHDTSLQSELIETIGSLATPGERFDTSTLTAVIDIRSTFGSVALPIECPNILVTNTTRGTRLYHTFVNRGDDEFVPRLNDAYFQQDCKQNRSINMNITGRFMRPTILAFETIGGVESSFNLQNIKRSHSSVKEPRRRRRHRPPGHSDIIGYPPNGFQLNTDDFGLLTQ